MTKALFLVVSAMWLTVAASPASAQSDFGGLLAYTNGDYATALNELIPMAKQGNADAQSFLGRMYDMGKGVAEDDAEAVRWYRAAAEQGNASAQVNLGTMYFAGFGVPQDDIEAVRWHRAVAAQGDSTAQYNLGLMYDEGTGVPQDYVTAYMWTNLAAGNGGPTDARDLIAAKMTPAEISETQRRARVCLESGYQDCE